MKLDRAFMRSRIARRIVALFVFSALVPISVVAWLAFNHVHDLLIDQGQRELAQLSEGYISNVYERLLAVDRQAQSIAGAYDGSGPWSAEVQKRAAGQLDAVVVVGNTGRITQLLGEVADPPLFPVGSERHLLDDGSVLVTQLRSTGPARIFLVRPIDPARVQGDRLVVEINPKYLWGDSEAFPAFTDFCAIDDRNAVVFCTQPTVPAAVRAFADGERPSARGRFKFEHDGEIELASFREMFMAARFYVHVWTIVAMRPEAGSLAALAGFRQVFVPATLLAILLVALLSVNQIRRTLIPLEKLIHGTRRAADKDFSVRVDVSGDDEFSELATSFNAMATRLGTQFTALITLADIDRAILSRLDVDRVLETVVMRMRDIVPADFVSVAVLDRNAGAMMRVYSRDQRANGPLEIERVPCPTDITQELLAAPEGAWRDACASATPYSAPIRRLGAAALFVLPIIWHESVVGMVLLGYASPTMLSDEEQLRARDLGDRVGVAFATAAKDEQLYFQAHYDTLTQLPNRLYFKDQLGRRLAQAQRDRKRFALLFIDLDHFKNVNDSHGHAAGDEVLRQAADRLRTCIREADAVARLGGDEFTVILSEIKTGRDAEVAANAIIKAMTAAFPVGAQEHYLNASIGMAIYPADGSTVDDLLRNADTAMYRAKDAGRGRAVYFEERMNAAALARVTFERDMRLAIEGNQFTLYYQPQQALGSGRIEGAEALVRWNHPERGLLAPMHFIQMAEETGLIERLGEWVLQAACRQFVAWEQAGVALPRIAVNVSARQFKQKDFLNVVTRVLEETGMRPQALELEITESLLMDASRNVEITLGKLSALGIRLAMDDFGTGYSSLAYLKRFPVDTVKIDRSFIKDLPGEESSGAITAAIIAMAHALHKEVIAEGVAEADQATFLRRLHCDLIQGFHLSRPLPADAFAQFLHARAGPEDLIVTDRAA